MINLLGTELERWFKYSGNGTRRASSLTQRDQAILWGLHVTRTMSTPQIACELFSGQQAAKARTRLIKLMSMGLIDRSRGGRQTGSEPYLWTLTEKGLRTLKAQPGGPIPVSGGEREDPEAWLIDEKAKHTPCSWMGGWGSERPGRLDHDLAVIDFLISYRRTVDAILAQHADEGDLVSEWRCEHVFLPPLDDSRERPITTAEACHRALPHGVSESGFEANSRLRS